MPFVPGVAAVSGRLDGGLGGAYHQLITPSCSSERHGRVMMSDDDSWHG